MSSSNQIPHRNFDNDTCCEAYCPCCPRCNCNCNCDCNCNCNCTKKKMIIPTFILSGVAFILIIIEMITKVTDTDSFIQFKKAEKTTLPDYEKYKYAIDDILEIEDSENKFTLALFIISIFIFIVYLILLICFIYEQVCFANYNPKCKQPYYLLMMILNFIACLANAMICFIFMSYRSDSIADYCDLPYFDSDFKSRNSLNMALDIIAAFCYLFCLVLHLITCYYLYKEDGICSGCCSEFISCITCCGECLRCFFCCCCCDYCDCCFCCCRRRAIQGKVTTYPEPVAQPVRAVQIFPQNILPSFFYSNQN